jgi:hypothetical protein
MKVQIHARVLLLPPLVFLLSSCLISLDMGKLESPYPDGWQDVADTDGAGEADALDESRDDPGLDPPRDDEMPDPPDDVIDTESDSVAPGDCYRRILITAPGDEDLVDYQVPIHLPHSPSMRADFGDLRFVLEEGGSFLSYFLEPAPDGGSVTAWVKVPLIPAGADTGVFVYYGDSTLTNVGDPWAVFDFYDPFDDGELSGWTELPDVGAWGLSSSRARSGTYSIEVSNVDNDPGSSNYLIADVPATADSAVDSWWTVSAVPVDIAIMLRCETSLPMSNVQANYDTEDEWHLARNTGGVWDPLATVNMTLPTSRWFKVTVAIVGDSMRLLIDDVLVLPLGDGWFDMGTGSPDGRFGFDAYRIPAGTTWWVDDVRMRKAANPEPVVELGDEVCAG